MYVCMHARMYVHVWSPLMSLLLSKSFWGVCVCVSVCVCVRVVLAVVHTLEFLKIGSSNTTQHEEAWEKHNERMLHTSYGSYDEHRLIRTLNLKKPHIIPTTAQNLVH